MSKTCPSCNGKNIAKIFLGLPADMNSIEDALERKEIICHKDFVTSDDEGIDLVVSEWKGGINSLLTINHDF